VINLQEKEILALILARGGSKGIPKKNIKQLCGKPLIAYTIEAAFNSECINRVVVSTDDDEIAEIAKKWGADVPFKRPEKLATDTATSNDAIVHALNWLLKNENYTPELFLNLQATSPFRDKKDIDKAIKKFIDSDADSLISVTETDKSPYWMRTIDENGYLNPIMETDKKYNRRQDLPSVYVLNGAIYMMESIRFLKNRKFNIGNVLPYIMDKISSVDIDNMLDWKFAEFLMEEKNND